MDIETSVAEWIKELRVVHCGLTQHEFAAEIGAGISTIVSWEKGYTTPSPAYLRALNDIAGGAGFSMAPQVDRRRGPQKG